MIAKTPLTRIAKIVLLTLLLAGPFRPASAAQNDELEFARELDACVAALNERLDLQGVVRIRHIVTKYNTKGLGYSLTINTKTFTDTAEKKYSAVCVATGDSKPSRLKVEEIRT